MVISKEFNHLLKRRAKECKNVWNSTIYLSLFLYLNQSFKGFLWGKNIIYYSIDFIRNFLTFLNKYKFNTLSKMPRLVTPSCWLPRNSRTWILVRRHQLARSLANTQLADVWQDTAGLPGSPTADGRWLYFLLGHVSGPLTCLQLATKCAKVQLGAFIMACQLFLPRIHFPLCVPRRQSAPTALPE